MVRKKGQGSDGCPVCECHVDPLDPDRFPTCLKRCKDGYRVGRGQSGCECAEDRAPSADGDE